MPATRSRIPSYRHHKRSGQAVATIAGRDRYLGKFNNADSYYRKDGKPTKEPVNIRLALRPLRRGFRESQPVRPVPDECVDAIEKFVSRQVRAMVQLQRLTGMGSGEVCAMRTGDLDMSGPVWCYVPASHKTEHHGRERRVYLGPEAQAILRGWLRADPAAYLF